MQRLSLFTPAIRSIALALSALCALSASIHARAQDYPSRPLQIIVPFSAGGSLDVAARAFAQVLSGKIQQSVVIVNRDGGSTTVGMNALLAAPADGYTLVYGTNTALTVHPHWMKGLQFKMDSFAPVCQTFENIFVLATKPGSRFTSINVVLADARANPGKLSYGHPGVSSAPHLAGAEFFQRAGTSANDISFRGEATMLPTLLSGEIDVGVVTVGFATVHSLKALAVFSEKRLAQMPNVPTVKELGLPVSPLGYGGLFVRANTPPAVMASLEKACRDAVADPIFREFAQRQYQQPDFLGSEAFKARIRSDSQAMEVLLRTVKLDR